MSDLRPEATALSDLGGPHWRDIADALPGPMFIGDGKGRSVFTNNEFQRFTGQGAEALKGDGWLSCLHPDDHARARSAWRRAVEGKSPHDEQYRLIARDREARWFRFRASPTLSADGAVVRWICVAFDCHDQKLAEQQRDLIIEELRHRTKNLWAIVNSVADLTCRTARDLPQFQSMFRQRILALARANDALMARDWKSCDLRSVIQDEIAALGDAAAGRCQIDGPNAAVTDSVALSLSLIIHELVTNAAKYGALTSAEGKLDIRWSLHRGRIRLEWVETGGPPVSGGPRAEGFGTRLIRTVAERELGSPSVFIFDPAGVRCTFEFEACGEM